MKKKLVKASLLAVLLLSLSVLLSVAAGAASYSTTFPSPENNLEKNLLTAEEAMLVDEEDLTGIRFTYTLDRELLARIEESYTVTVGALVARAENGYAKNTLTLKHNKKANTFSAPEQAKMLTVYSTGGARQTDGCFLDENESTFTLTVSLGSKTVERTGSEIVALGFVILEDPSGASDARVLYVTRNGADYGAAPSFETMVRNAYFASDKDETAMNEYIDFVQTQMKSEVEMLSDTRVFVCGEDFERDLLPGERVIWVQYLPDRDPYPDDRDPDKAGIRAAYIYYPQNFDPNLDYSASDLIEEGALRFFAYIGIPDGRPADGGDFPGIVCVHGGGGHAYAEYTLEAVKQGYAAIAFDTEGCHNLTGRNAGAYSAADSSYPKDKVSHVGKDGFASVEKPLSEQWLYYAVCDTAIANTVLRSMSEVDENAVGVTGISWGGLITSTAICYDHRFAFAAPIYISFHVAESHSAGVGGLKTNAFAAALWQDENLLAKSPVPTLIITSEFDHWASVDTASKSAHDLSNGGLLIKPGLAHGQQQGASLPEIYHFGYHVLGKNGGFVTMKDAPTAESGRSYTLTTEIPSDITDVKATLYYRTEPFYEYVQSNRPTFEKQELTVAADGTVAVEIPTDACMYFISFSGYNEEVYLRKGDRTPYSYSDAYERGYVYASTDIIFLP